MADQEFIPTVPQVYDAEGNVVAGDYENLAQSFMAGQTQMAPDELVPVRSPYGEVGTLPAAELAEALKSGYMIDTPKEQLARFNEEKYSTGSEMAKAALEGGARGLTVGLSDVALKALGADAEAMRLRREINPVTAGVGEVAGMLAPAVLSGGASLLGEGAAATGLKAIAKASPMELVTSAGRGVEGIAAKALATTEASGIAARALAKVAPKMAGSAVEGALFGGGNFLSEVALGDQEATAENLLANVGLGAALGAGAGALVGGVELASPMMQKGLSAAREKVDDGVKKTLSAMFGTDVQTMDKYIERGGKEYLDKVTPLDDLIFDYQTRMSKLSDDVSSAQLSAAESKAAYTKLEKEFYDEAKEKGLSSTEISSEAKDLFTGFKEQEVKNVENKLYEAADKASAAINKVQQSYIEASQAIKEGLKGETVDISQAFGRMNDVIEPLEKKARSFPEYRGALQYVKDFKQSLFDEYGAFIPANELKDKIIGLDSVINWQQMEVKDQVLKQVRHALDEDLKLQFPAYKKAMLPVAEQAEAVAKLSRLKKEDFALSSLRNFDAAKEKFMLPYLRKVEAMTGDKFVDDILAHAHLAKNLKESEAFKLMQDTERIRKFYKNPRQAQMIEEALKGSSEYQSMEAAVRAATDAKLAKDGLEGLSQASVKGLFEKAARGDQRSLENIKKIEKAFNSPELTRKLEDAGIKKAFEKGYIHGSRNVNAWGATGAIIGSVFGHGGAAAIPGMIFGMIVDKYGGKVTQMMLNRFSTYVAMEKMGISATEKVASHVADFFGASSMKSAIAEKAIPIITSQQDKKIAAPEQKKAPQKVSVNEYRSIKENLSNMVADPSILIDRVNDNASPLHESAPNVAGQFVNKAVIAATFLHDKLPKDPLEKYHIGMQTDQWTPSDQAMAKFNRYYQTVNDPSVALNDFKHGTLASEQVEALKVVYPKMYGEIQSHVLDHLTEYQVKLPYEKKLKLGMLLGVPLDASSDPAFISSMQGIYAQAAQANQPRPANARVANMERAGSMMSGTERTLTRA